VSFGRAKAALRSDAGKIIGRNASFRGIIGKLRKVNGSFR
jgi:hypothetical protein